MFTNVMSPYVYVIEYPLENGSQRILNVIGQFQNLSHFFLLGGLGLCGRSLKNCGKKHDMVVYILENPGFTLEIYYSYFFHT